MGCGIYRLSSLKWEDCQSLFGLIIISNLVLLIERLLPPLLPFALDCSRLRTTNLIRLLRPGAIGHPLVIVNRVRDAIFLPRPKVKFA